MKKDLINEIKTILADHDANEGETIRKIKKLMLMDEKPDFSKMQPGDKFSYRGKDWIFLGYEPSAEKNEYGALCITEKIYAEIPFDTDRCNNWCKSSVRKELEKKFLPTLDKEDLLPFVMDLTADNGDKSYGFAIELVGILSCDLYRKYRDFVPLFSEWMWTCTPWVCNSPYERYVDTDGHLGGNYAYSSYGVVPACLFKIQ